MQLPAGAVIDLGGSWFGDAPSFLVTTGSPAFPSGTIVDPNNPTPAISPAPSPPLTVYAGLYIVFSPSARLIRSTALLRRERDHATDVLLLAVATN